MGCNGLSLTSSPADDDEQALFKFLRGGVASNHTRRHLTSCSIYIASKLKAPIVFGVYGHQGKVKPDDFRTVEKTSNKWSTALCRFIFNAMFVLTLS